MLRVRLVVNAGVGMRTITDMAQLQVALVMETGLGAGNNVFMNMIAAGLS